VTTHQALGAREEDGVRIDQGTRPSDTGAVRVLAVISDELLGTDDARDWALLESLVAANSPQSIDVDVLALVNQPKQSVAYANPLGRATGRMAAGQTETPEPFDAEDSARQRLSRSLQHVRSLGLHATGQTASGHTYDVVRQKAREGSYDRVLLLLAGRPSWLTRVSHRTTADRLQHSLHIPVEALNRSE